MLVVTRFRVDPDSAVDFLERCRGALAALAARPGYRQGRIGRAADDVAEWILTTEWEGVGAYRRALGSYEVKLQATPVLALARPEVSAYEIVHGETGPANSDRAPGADQARVGEAGVGEAGVGEAGVGEGGAGEPR